MSTSYIIAQVFGICAWFFFLLSYHAKRENKAIGFHIISSLFYIVNYFILDATAGFLISAFELVKDVGYYKTDKDKYIYLFSLPVYVFIGLYAGNNLFILVPIIASLIDGYVALKDKKTMVIGGIISNSIWIIYDFAFANYSACFSDVFLVLSNATILLYGFSKYYHRNYVYATRVQYISKSTFRRISKLDKQLLDKQYVWVLDDIVNIYNKEKRSYILIKYKNIVIGYVNLLSLTKEYYDELINSNTMYKNIDIDRIKSFKKNENLHLIMNSIILKNEYQNKDSINKISNSIDKFVRKMKKDGYHIKEISMFAITPFENKVAIANDFVKERDITNECILYKKTIK